jgi:hypothetical protein
LTINRFLLTITFLFIFPGNGIVAQNAASQPLENILLHLEDEFNVVFTYADENVQGISVPLPQASLNLNEYLIYLEKQTGLSFKKLNSRYVAIQKNSKDVVINGFVHDKTTKEPLVGAVIYTNDKYTISNEKGWFSIQVNPDKDSAVIIRYTGYKQRVFTEDEWKKDTAIIVLTLDVMHIEEVVFDYIATGIDKLADGTIQMNMKNMEILPGLSEPDVLHTVQVLPGIQSVNETVSDINIRGGTNDQTLVLWEGVKMYQTGHFFGLISGFNSHLVHKTTVIKNGTSAAYDEGISGTVDMKLQDYHVNKVGASAGVDMLSADAVIKIPVSKKLSFQLGARHSINDLFITPTYKSYYKRAFQHTDVMQEFSYRDSAVDEYHDFSFYDVSFKILYDVSPKDKFRLGFLTIENSIGYEESAWVRDTLYKKQSHLRQSSMLSNAEYTRNWNNNHESRLAAYVSTYNLAGTDAELLNGQNHEQKNEVLDWGMKLETKHSIGEKIKLSSGYQFDEIGIRNQDNINNPGYSRDVKDVLWLQALYSEIAINRWIENLYLRFGVRATYIHEFNEFIPEPRAVINYQVNDHLSLEVLAEKKSQFTTQLIDYQTDFLGIEKRRWVLSNNTSIPVIKSQQVSFGAQYNRNRFLFSVEAYKKQVDGIVSPSQGFQNQFQYVYSIGSYNTEGFDALLNKRFKNMNVWLNYSLARNDYHFREFTPSTFPNNLDIRHILSLGASYNIKNLELSGGLNYRTGRPYTRLVKETGNNKKEIAYETPNHSRMEDFMRLDVSAKYNIQLDKINTAFGMSIWNILDRKNVINIFYQQYDTDDIEEIKQFALGITPNVYVRFSF